MFTVRGTGIEDMNLELSRIKGQLKNVDGFLTNLSKWIEEQEAQQFKKEGGAYPPKWAALSKEYAKWKGQHYPGKGILERTGDLKTSLTTSGSGIRAVHNGTLTFGTLVEYAAYHQNGTKTMPARPVLIRTDKTFKRAVEKQLQRWILEHNR
ncbi:phage virion morphogenesis protein [Brevibacterium moorei]|uniref:phage virion morphogenesis protein n=1 Tax=Brevibacterium moorei TaxID=2968457 RepID=UPI00211B7E04|nr:phage virion morphogenesis protein [Brevibacterium sp. 68QC2CO]MCQ9384446.1 phage virion morphogenesis protein [Brevibacterium sp. 68QC2CO]